MRLSAGMALLGVCMCGDNERNVPWSLKSLRTVPRTVHDTHTHTQQFVCAHISRWPRAPAGDKWKIYWTNHFDSTTSCTRSYRPAALARTSAHPLSERRLLANNEQAHEWNNKHVPYIQCIQKKKLNRWSMYFDWDNSVRGVHCTVHTIVPLFVLDTTTNRPQRRREATSIWRARTSR